MSSVSNHQISYDQSQLINQIGIGIPIELKYDFVELKIESPQKLNVGEIQRVAKIALEATTYVKLGFGVSADVRREELKRSFHFLDQNKIEFTAVASVYSHYPKNVHYPSSFQK